MMSLTAAWCDAALGDITGHAVCIDVSYRTSCLRLYLFLVFFSFIFLFVPCGRLSWLPVSFLLHVKYTLSYRIVLSNLAVASPRPLSRRHSPANIDQSRPQNLARLWPNVSGAANGFNEWAVCLSVVRPFVSFYLNCFILLCQVKFDFDETWYEWYADNGLQRYRADFEYLDIVYYANYFQNFTKFLSFLSVFIRFCWNLMWMICTMTTKR